MKNRSKYIVPALFLILAATGCGKEQEIMPPGLSDIESVSFSVEESDPDELTTKSILTDASIETKRSGVTLGVYHNGTLSESMYSTSFSGLTFSLVNGESYHVVALVNMGDLRATLPASQTSLETFTYTIPAYTGTSTSINSMGIPMAGSLDYTVGTSSVSAIPVERLLAKVTAVLSCDWNGAKIKNAKIYNMNSRLKPFGVSAAAATGDMLAFQEEELASVPGATSLVGTFYVPENMQGVVNGITSSEGKSKDQNSSVAAMADKLTYLQVEVETEGKYDGSIVYRSYLGNNKTTDFNIQRNTKYNWTIHYNKATVNEYDEDWKRDFGDLEVVDYSLSLSPNPKTLSTGSTFTYTTTLNRNVILPAASSSSTVLSNASAIWESSNTAVATVNASGVVTGVAAGTATITARFTPSGSDLTQKTAYATVTVQEIGYDLVVSATGQTSGLRYNETASLSATFYTTTNGVRDAGVDVTASANWSISNTSKYAVSEGIVSANPTASVPSIAGSVSVSASLPAGFVSGLSSTINSNALSVSFVDITTATTTVSPASASGTYLSPAVFSARHVRTVNGFTTMDSDVTSAANWSVNDARYNVSAGTVTADASTGTHSVAGTATVTATYGGDSDNATVTFTDIVTNNLSVVPASGSIQAGGASVQLAAYYTTIRNGYEVENANVSTSASWSSNNDNVAVGAHTGTVTANLLATGIADITAEYSDKSASCTLTINGPTITHRLEVTSANTTASVGQNIALVAKYYTTTNGVEDTGVVVTTNESTSWSKISGATSINVNNNGGYKGQASATSGGIATIRATYAGESDEIEVTFNNVYSLVIKPANATLTVGSSKTYLAYLVTNGNESATAISSGVTWSSSNTGIATINSTTGVVAGVAVGTTTITACYTPSGSSQISQSVSLTIRANSGIGFDDDWDNGGEIELD